MRQIIIIIENKFYSVLSNKSKIAENNELSFELEDQKTDFSFILAASTDVRKAFDHRRGDAQYGSVSQDKV